MTNSEYEKQELSRLVSLLNNVLEEKIEITQACREITDIIKGCNFEQNLFATFIAVDSETDAFPLGEVRDYWDKKALEEMDIKRREAECFYKDVIFDAARELLQIIAAQKIEEVGK